MGLPLTVEEFEQQGSECLSPDVRDYINGGAGREWTLAAGRAAFDRLGLRPRVLVDVSAPDPSVRLLGCTLGAPIGVAPMAFHRLVHPEGEQATASAAGREGALFITSIFASQSLEDIAAAASGPLWLQLYWLRDREALAGLAHRAELAGYRALVLTVDAARVARRVRDLRNSFSVPAHIRAVNLDPSLPDIGSFGAEGVSAIEAHSRDQFDTTITWRDLAWLTSRTRLPLVLKGVLTAQDALAAAEHGVAAVIVSNHGGRQLDGAVPGLVALPDIADAVADRIPVLYDGAVRCGSDIAKALALGARTVLVGRPVLWGLAYGGRDGAAAVLRLLRQELEEVMILSGRPKLADFGRDAVTALPH